jgi:hypothetical protein
MSETETFRSRTAAGDGNEQTPLDAKEELQRDDFVRLMRDVIEQ